MIFEEEFPSLTKTQRVNFEGVIRTDEPMQPQIDNIINSVRLSIQKEIQECCLDKAKVKTAINDILEAEGCDDDCTCEMGLKIQEIKKVLRL